MNARSPTKPWADEPPNSLEASLLAAEFRLQATQSLARVGDFELDRDTARMSWSPELFSLFERPQSRGVPDVNEALAYYTPESLDRTRDLFWHAIDTGERCTLEQEVTLPSGELRHHATVIEPVSDASGRVYKLYGIVQDITERKRLELERIAHVTRLAELSRHLVDSEERERRQLASALHDRASPNLAALQITFSNLAGALPASVLAELEPLLDDAAALLADTAAGIREICTNLRPATLDYAGLVPAVQEYADQFARRTGLGVTTVSPSAALPLAPELQTLMFRIVQEALTNCAKHAHARNVRIRLASTGNGVSLSISDDGLGFEPTQLGRPGAAPGLGLITMKERTEFAGGRFFVRSRPGAGTEIEVRFENPPALPERSS